MRHAVQTAAPLPALPGPGGNHSCLECPVCGSEECRVLADLGMYCDTALAAWQPRDVRAASARSRPRRPAARRR